MAGAWKDDPRNIAFLASLAARGIDMNSLPDEDEIARMNFAGEILVRGAQLGKKLDRVLDEIALLRGLADEIRAMRYQPRSREPEK